MLYTCLSFSPDWMSPNSVVTYYTNPWASWVLENPSILKNPQKKGCKTLIKFEQVCPQNTYLCIKSAKLIIFARERTMVSSAAMTVCGLNKHNIFPTTTILTDKMVISFQSVSTKVQ